MVPRPLQKLGGDSKTTSCVHSGDSTWDDEFNSYMSCFLTLIKSISILVLHTHHLFSFVP